MTVQSIFQYLQDDINNRSEDEKIWRAINTAIRSVSKSYAWSWLRRSITVTNTEDATTGFLLPANMIDVIDPIDDGSGVVYQRVDASLVKNLPTGYRKYWFFDDGRITPLAETEGVDINTDSTALTFSPSLPSGDHTGEFLRLTGRDGEDWGVHELASNTNLVSAYRGPRISGGYYVLRPSTAKRISFTDYTGDRVAAEETVHYWIYPDILLAPQQEIPDVWELPVRLMAGLELSTATYDKKSEEVRLSRLNQYKQELSDAQVADGRPPMVDLPQDNTGHRINMGWRNR